MCPVNHEGPSDSGGGGGGAVAVADLTDVDLTTYGLSDFDALLYAAGTWYSTALGLEVLGKGTQYQFDVNSSLNEGDYLAFDPTLGDDGMFKAVPAPAGGGGGVTRERITSLVESALPGNARFTRSLTGANAGFTWGGSVDGYFTAGNTLTGKAGVNLPMEGLNNFWDRSPGFANSVLLWAGGAPNGGGMISNTFVGCGDVGFGGTAFTPTRKHLGFIFKNNDGTTEIYASVGDGTTQSSELVATPSPSTAYHHYAAEIIEGVAHYYIDGVEVADISTNIPSGVLESTQAVWSAYMYNAAAVSNDFIYLVCHVDVSYQVSL